METIQVFLSSKGFSKNKILPVCKQAVALTRLTGKKTLDAQSISAIKDLGYKIEIVSSNIFMGEAQ